MSDATQSNPAINGEAAAINGEAAAATGEAAAATGEAAAATGEAAAATGEAAAASPETTASTLKTTAQHKVQQALALAKTHPLGAVATVAAAAALVEVELAVGILAGLGATAFLATQSGPEARQRVIARGRKAIARARLAIAQRSGGLNPGVAPNPSTPVDAPPPPAA